MQMREKVGKSQNTMFFQWFVAPEIRKVGSIKRRVRSQLVRWEMKKCTPLWREGRFEVKMYKTHQVRTTFGSWDVEKVHAVVARRTFRSQNVQDTPGPDHFWKLRCKVHAVAARSTCRSQTVKKNWHVRSTFGGSDVASRGRRKGLCTLSKMSKTSGFCSIFNYNHHYTTLHSNTLHYTTTTPSLHSTTLHSTTLHCTQLHSTTLHYITLHYTTLHYTTLHYIALHYTTLPSTTLQCITLHSTTLHYTTLHYTMLHYTEWHCTTDTQVDR